MILVGDKVRISENAWQVAVPDYELNKIGIVLEIFTEKQAPQRKIAKVETATKKAIFKSGYASSTYWVIPFHYLEEIKK